MIINKWWKAASVLPSSLLRLFVSFDRSRVAYYLSTVYVVLVVAGRSSSLALRSLQLVRNWRRPSKNFLSSPSFCLLSCVETVVTGVYS